MNKKLLRKYEHKVDLTFICRKGNAHFAQPIIKYLKKYIPVQEIYPNSSIGFWRNNIQGKIIWVEWARAIAKVLSSKPLKNQKLIIRLHRGEIETKYMKKINWENVSLLVFINDKLKNKFHSKYGNIVQTITIPNAVPIDAYPLHNTLQNSKSIIAYSYSFFPVKGYIELITFFNKLYQIDSTYSLTIMAQNTKQPSSKRNLKSMKLLIIKLQLSNAVKVIENKLLYSISENQRRVSEELSNHGIIISFSQIESFHYSFAEGLLSGLQGFYNMWDNTMLIEFWKSWGYNSESEMLEGILEWGKLSHDKKMIRLQKNRDYIISNFGAEVIGKKYMELFNVCN
tara:strand:+ start:2405 stop:3427 length:1023 start_codon:yes stop_codon:yes gene_type:complete